MVAALSWNVGSAGLHPALAQPATEPTVVTETEYVSPQAVASVVPPTSGVPTEVPHLPVQTEVSHLPVPTDEPHLAVQRLPTAPATQAPTDAPTEQARLGIQTPLAVTTPTTPTTTVTATTATAATPATATTVTTTTTVTAATTVTPPTTTSDLPETSVTTAAAESTTDTEETEGRPAQTEPPTLWQPSEEPTAAGTSNSSTPPTVDSTASNPGPTGADEPADSSGAPGPSSAGQTQSAELAAGTTQVAEPRRLQAAPEDVKLAQRAEPVQVDPPPASKAEIDRLRRSAIRAANPGPDDTGGAIPADGLAAHRVMQWQPDWVQYDEYSRPLILNPFPDSLELIYEVAGSPRILPITPLGRIVTEVAEPGSYNFTALRVNAIGLVSDVAVGNFFGGGYYPGDGVPPPPPPPPGRTLRDVPVQVKYAKATYEPIVVRNSSTSAATQQSVVTAKSFLTASRPRGVSGSRTMPA